MHVTKHKVETHGHNISIILFDILKKLIKQYINSTYINIIHFYSLSSSPFCSHLLQDEKISSCWGKHCISWRLCVSFDFLFYFFSSSVLKWNSFLYDDWHKVMKCAGMRPVFLTPVCCFSSTKMSLNVFRVNNHNELLSDSSKKARRSCATRGVFSPRTASVKLGRLQA